MLYIYLFEYLLDPFTNHNCLLTYLMFLRKLNLVGV